MTPRSSPHPGRADLGSRLLKVTPSLVKETLAQAEVKEGPRRTRLQLGELQHLVLRYLYERHVRQFTLSELVEGLRGWGYGVDPRRVHQSLSGLVRRGFVRWVDWGLYEVAVDLELLLTNCVVTKRSPRVNKPRENSQLISSTDGLVKETEGTRGAPESAPWPPRSPLRRREGIALYYHNVRGYRRGRYVRTGRGVELAAAELSDFSHLSYLEVGYVSPLPPVLLGGQVVVYARGGRVRVEWRPPSGFVEGRGLSELNAYFAMVVAEALLHLLPGVAQLLGSGSLAVALRRLGRTRLAGLLGSALARACASQLGR